MNETVQGVSTTAETSLGGNAKLFLIYVVSGLLTFAVASTFVRMSLIVFAKHGPG